MTNYLVSLNQENELYSVLTTIKKDKHVYVIKGFGELDFKDYGIERLVDIPDSEYYNDLYDTSSLTQVPLKMMAQKTFIISFEDFLLIADSFIPISKIYGYTISIIENNLFHNYYPLAERFQGEFLVSSIDNDKENNITSIFDDYLIIDNVVFASYQAFQDYIDVKTRGLYDIESLPQPNNITDTSVSTSFGISDENFTMGLVEILKNKALSFSIAFDKDNIPQYQIDTLRILSSLGYTVAIAKRELQTTSTVELVGYEDILRRKNPNYKFRNIDFYKNPGYSLETISVSQAEIVNAICENAKRANDGGKYNDIFVTAPTGAGKSILFQIPAIYLAEKYNLFTIVVTPLIGLMNDQVENIKSMTDKAATINSEYTPEEKEDIKTKIQNNEISILYVSPETLLSNNPIESLIGYERKIGLLVIDESHIVTTWGKSFRPDYWFLGDYISALRIKQGKRFPIATFSATITYGGNDDMHGDIIDSLKMKTGDYEYIAPMRRDDIQFQISLHNTNSDYQLEKDETVRGALKGLIDSNKKTIVYFPYTSQVNKYDQELSAYGVYRYHGKLSKEEKDSSLTSFRSDKSGMILATKAFGMGIDIDDIDVVYHYAPTGTLCDYVQEIGRVARDPALIGTASLDFYESDYRYINQLFGMSSIKNYQIIEVLKKIRDLYLSKKKRNIVVSSEEFAYIFSNSSSTRDTVDSSFKTTLLMIQKDFERMPYINFKPIVFKPRAMFARAFVMVTDDLLKSISHNSVFKRYFRLFATKDQMAANFIDRQTIEYIDSFTDEKKTFTRNTPTKVTYAGDVYVVNMKSLWEEQFNDISYAYFKYCFYEGLLPGQSWTKDVKPEYILTLTPNFKNFSDMMDEFDRILTNIAKALGDSNFDKEQFKIEDIAQIIGSSIDSEMNHFDLTIAANNIVEVINRFNIGARFNTQWVFKTNSQTERYSLVSINLLKSRINSIKVHCRKMLNTVRYANRKVFLIGQKKALDRQSGDIMVAQLLETFKLATFEVTSGDIPEYFLRINSVSAIDRILNNPNYQSEMVQLVRYRHEESKKIMTHFFTSLNSDSARWNFIERYFAGLPLDY